MIFSPSFPIESLNEVNEIEFVSTRKKVPPILWNAYPFEIDDQVNIE